jgi:hypothetical protein
MGRKRKVQPAIETVNITKTPLEQFASLPQDKLAKLLALLDGTTPEPAMASDRPVEVAEDDIVERKIKVKKGQVSKIFRGSAPVGQLAPLTGGVIMFTGKDDPAERAYNAKRAKPKVHRPRYSVIKCDGGCGFEGPEKLFTSHMQGKGKRLCPECDLKKGG